MTPITDLITAESLIAAGLILLLLFIARLIWDKPTVPAANDTTDPTLTAEQAAWLADPTSAPPERHTEVLAYLATLPQFFCLADQQLIDWHSGTKVKMCPCDEAPFPHLMVSWSTDRALGMRSEGVLAHFTAFHTQVAEGLRQGACHGASVGASRVPTSDSEVATAMTTTGEEH